MAKNKTLFLILIGAALSFGAAGQVNLKSGPSCVVQTAQHEIGVHELTGNNDGKQVEVYLSAVHLKKGNPWCAAFVAWCHDRCNISHPVSGFSPDWFRQHIIYKRDLAARPLYIKFSGGVFGIWFASKNRVAHVGIIESANQNYVVTIEGNTNEAGSREGDGVYRKRRLLKQIYVVSKWDGTNANGSTGS